MPTSDRSTAQTTTIRLPRRLYEEARRVLKEGETKAGSLNELLVQSLEERLERVRREWIDRQFAPMKDDVRHQRETATLARQFASNDRETLRRAERDADI